MLLHMCFYHPMSESSFFFLCLRHCFFSILACDLGPLFSSCLCWASVVLDACNRRRKLSVKLGNSSQKLQSDNESGSKFPSSSASTVLLKIGRGMLALQFILVVDESGVDSHGLEAGICCEIW